MKNQENKKYRIKVLEDYRCRVESRKMKKFKEAMKDVKIDINVYAKMIYNNSMKCMLTKLNNKELK